MHFAQASFVKLLASLVALSAACADTSSNDTSSAPIYILTPGKDNVVPQNSALLVSWDIAANSTALNATSDDQMTVEVVNNCTNVTVQSANVTIQEGDGNIWLAQFSNPVGPYFVRLSVGSVQAYSDPFYVAGNTSTTTGLSASDATGLISRSDIWLAMVIAASCLAFSGGL